MKRDFWNLGPKPIPALLLALVCMGCSTTTVIRPGHDLYLEGKAVLIKKDGSDMKVRNPLVRGDTISIVDSRLGNKIRIPVSEARKLVVNKRPQGALVGALLFAGMGAAFGSIPDPDCTSPCLGPNGGVAGSIIWAGIAAPVGAGLGGLVAG